MAAAEAAASPMPAVPASTALRGGQPGTLSSMPTTAVNTMRETTRGLHSSRYCRARRNPTGSNCASGPAWRGAIEQSGQHGQQQGCHTVVRHGDFQWQSREDVGNAQTDLHDKQYAKQRA